MRLSPIHVALSCLLLTACSDPPPGEESALDQRARKATEMRDTMQRPIDKAKTADDAQKKAAEDQRKALEDQGG
ncbi:hypothetical protein [Arenimonas sp.]|uniref:hypothetical protein n=1 Tax=Arenimonas sp. TaxID=1872635 RepID=UPI0039E64548